MSSNHAASSAKKSDWPRRISVGNISTIYLLVALVVIFSIWSPALFLDYLTLVGILNDNAVLMLLALALVVPLACGVFDLSVAYVMGVSSVWCAYLVGPQDMSVAVAIPVVLLSAAAIGCVTATVVVVFKIDSFIGTLAVGSLLQALIVVISDNQTISAGVSAKLFTISALNMNLIRFPVAVALGVLVVMWFVMGHTAVGRSLYATGLGTEAARLAGIRVDVLRFASLVVSAVIAGTAGIMVTAIVGAGSPTIGPPYLIPAFAAAFLGATQFRWRLFNPVGTGLAVLVLGTVTAGLSLAGVPVWTPYAFQGLVLIGALGLGGLQRRPHRAEAESVVSDDTTHRFDDPGEKPGASSEPSVGTRA